MGCLAARRRSTSSLLSCPSFVCVPLAPLPVTWRRADNTAADPGSMCELVNFRTVGVLLGLLVLLVLVLIPLELEAAWMLLLPLLLPTIAVPKGICFPLCLLDLLTLVVVLLLLLLLDFFFFEGGLDSEPWELEDPIVDPSMLKRFLQLFASIFVSVSVSDSSV